MSSIERRTFRSVDMEIGYQVEGGGPVTVCLHGGKGNSGDYFHPYLSPLAESGTMVYLDERGSGRSKPVPDARRISYAGMAADIANLADHLGERQIAVLGHSFGASLALYFAVHYPERVRELILVAGGITYPGIRRDWWPAFFAAATEDLDIAAAVRAVQARYNAGEISADESFRRTVLAQAPSIIYHWPAKRAEVEAVFARTDFTYLGHANFGDEAAVQAEMLSRLGEIACPTLIVYGQHDISCPLECAGAMARGIPQSHVVVLPRARHFPFIDEPELFVAAIRQFRHYR